MKPRHYVYKFKCSDCDLIFFIENNGQFDSYPAACPCCENDDDVDIMNEKVWIEEGEHK